MNDLGKQLSQKNNSTKIDNGLIDKLIKKNNDLANKIKFLDNQTIQILEKKGQLETENLNLVEQLDIHKNLVQDLESKNKNLVEELESKNKNLVEQLDSHKNIVKELENHLQSLKNENNNLNHKLCLAENKVIELENKNKHVENEKTSKPKAKFIFI